MFFSGFLGACGILLMKQNALKVVRFESSSKTLIIHKEQTKEINKK